MVKNTDIFLGSGASITKIPELDIYFPIQETSGTVTTVTANGSTTTTVADVVFGTDFSLVNNLYVGCLFRKYSSGNALQTTHRITANTATTISFTPSATLSSGDYFVIDNYGAPCPAPKINTDKKTLLADTWLGIVESLTFPTTEVEMKQTNISLGGKRNFTYQYKGIETAGAADINLVANQGTWLYYFFGKCTNVDIGNVNASDVLVEAGLSGSNPANRAVPASENGIYINYDDVEETGPIFHRSIGTVMTPYVNPAQDTVAGLHIVTLPTVGTNGKIEDAIEYTFAEQDGDLLPSFALEQVFSKLVDHDGGTDIYETETAETNESFNFVKIARGCRVNTLTMTANENEEVKMTVNANTRNVHNLESNEEYTARRGVVDETNFFNFTATPELREPFFFSDGSLKAFNVDFLKVTSLTLTMNNSLTDKRYLGVGNKSIQEALPAQRTYEIQFNGYVTDNQLYKELINNTENTGSNHVELIFTKSTGENIVLKFKNYFLSANEFPMPDDKGPIEVSATIMPRDLQECKVRTHWMLQG